MVVELNWNDAWCDLPTVDLNDSRFDNVEGIYIIWHGGPEPAVIYVGCGILKYRFAAHREDRGVLAYGGDGLYVTWAQAEATMYVGIERYLSEKLRPKLGTYFSDVPPIEVNLPWPVSETQISIHICLH